MPVDETARDLAAFALPGFGNGPLPREFDVSTRTIRYYEEKGLIHPRREGRKRLYSPADRVRIKLILRGKRIGMTLKESVEVIDLYGTEEGVVDILGQD